MECVQDEESKLFELFRVEDLILIGISSVEHALNYGFKFINSHFSMDLVVARNYG